MNNLQITANGTMEIDFRTFMESYAIILDSYDAIQNNELRITSTKKLDEYRFEYNSESSNDYTAILALFQPFFKTLDVQLLDLEEMIVEKNFLLEQGEIVTYESNRISHYYEDADYSIFRDLLISEKDKWELHGFSMFTEEKQTGLKEKVISLFENTLSSQAIQNNLCFFMKEQFGIMGFEENKRLFSMEFAWNYLDDNARNVLSVYWHNNQFKFFVNFFLSELEKTNKSNPFIREHYYVEDIYGVDDIMEVRISLFNQKRQIISLPRSLWETLFKWFNSGIECNVDGVWMQPCFNCENHVLKIIEGCSECTFFEPHDNIKIKERL